MLKKDVAQFRKQLKIDNHLLKLHELLTCYVVKESDEIYFKQRVSFSLIEKEEQELYFTNLKKALTGQIDQKLFPLRFREDDGKEMQTMLYESLTSPVDDWEDAMVSIVESLLENNVYETDVVFTFVRGEYEKLVEKKVSEDDWHDGESFVNPFVFCTINETKMPENELLFDYVEKKFTYHVEVNPVINLQKPISGFLFPTFETGGANVNQVLFTTRKAYELDEQLLHNVLHLEVATTAEDDKIIFNEVVNRVAKEQINTKKLSQMYEEINERLLEQEEADEPSMLDYRDIEDVLVQSGFQQVEQEDVKEAFRSIVRDESYELKAENIVPKFTSKSIKIKTKVADFSLRPQDLQYVKQVKVDGKLCLMIELDESPAIDGFSVVPEAILTELSKTED